jgi:PAS domain S-box-containing protein
MMIFRMPGGELVEVNEGFVRMSGFTRTEAIGRTLRDLGMWERPEDEAQIRAALQSDGSVQNFAASLHDKDRQIHSCLVSGELIEVDGEPLAVTFTRDVTDRKVLEERLWQSQKLESIGRLAGGIAHDFNNYLSAILGYAEMAEKRLVGDEKTRGYLRNLRDASDRAAHLTRQLLAFARKQIIEPKVVSLNTLISTSDKMLRRVIGEDVEFSFHPGPHLPSVLIDPSQFDQVLMNLVVNARDAMPGGRRRVGQSAPTSRRPNRPVRQHDGLRYRFGDVRRRGPACL